MMRDPAKLTTRQVAERLGLGGDTDKVLSWIRSGELPAINVARKATGRPRYRVDPGDLALFVSRRRVRPQPDVTRRRRKRATTHNVIPFFGPDASGWQPT